MSKQELIKLMRLLSALESALLFDQSSLNLPLLPEPIFRCYNWRTESSLPGYSTDHMREYGQQCYVQALLDAMNATRAFGKTGEAMACAIRELK